jgi:hypothetical protein
MDTLWILTRRSSVIGALTSNAGHYSQCTHLRAQLVIVIRTSNSFGVPTHHIKLLSGKAPADRPQRHLDRHTSEEITVLERNAGVHM